MEQATASRSDEPRGVVAVGASAGGVEALTQLTAGLPSDLPYAVVVVLHLPARAPSVLARIIDRSGPLRAVAAKHGMHLNAGRIHVAVPDRHLLITDHRALLSTVPPKTATDLPSMRCSGRWRWIAAHAASACCCPESSTTE